MAPGESITGPIVGDGGVTEAEQIAVFAEGMVPLNEVPAHLRDEVTGVRDLIGRMSGHLTQSDGGAADTPTIVRKDGQPLEN